jgi:hypothetical protein
MATGVAILDFGVFPGKSDASVAVTGQAAIVAGSLVEAWIRPVATADHTDTEHMVETLKVFAADIVAGTGFTIYGFNDSQLNEGLEIRTGGRSTLLAPSASGPVGTDAPRVGGRGTLLYGQWTVAWAWV